MMEAGQSISESQNEEEIASTNIAEKETAEVTEVDKIDDDIIEEATNGHHSSPNSLKPCYSNENVNEQERIQDGEESHQQYLPDGQNGIAAENENDKQTNIEYTKESPKEAPRCLIDFRDRVEACSHRVQAWSDEQELKARQKQSRRREERDGGVRVQEDGKVVEATGDKFLERKGIIPLVAVILIWVYIVFTWRICANAIRKESRATATRNEGIGFLVGFNLLWLMVIWSYVKVVFTGPGYVRDHLPISEQPPSPKDDAFHDPQEPSTDLQLSSSTDSAADNRDPEAISETINAQTEQTQTNLTDSPEESVDPALAATLGPVGVGIMAQADEAEKVKNQVTSSNEQSNSEQQEKEAKPKAIPDPEAWAGPPEKEKTAFLQPPPPPTDGSFPEPKRMPQNSKPLHPSNTYCYRCRRYKPPRSHHCRHCGTCVLKMDHHCPWVGGCVGARNHKFFYNFLQWVTVLEYYVLVINATLFNRGLRRRGDGPDGQERWPIDGYMISLFPICAMFILFTTALLVTHTYLFVVNLSTIEHMGVDRQKTREDILIENWAEDRAKREGKPKPTWFAQIGERNAMKAKWSEYWGKPKTEANLFWLDGRFKPMIVGQENQIGTNLPLNYKKAAIKEFKEIPHLSWYDAIGVNWRQAMGDNIFGWFLPIGRARNANGLAYEANWRFGRQGEWTPRKDWSKKLNVD